MPHYRISFAITFDQSALCLQLAFIILCPRIVISVHFGLRTQKSLVSKDRPPSPASANEIKNRTIRQQFRCNVDTNEVSLFITFQHSNSVKHNLIKNATKHPSSCELAPSKAAAFNPSSIFHPRHSAYQQKGPNSQPRRNLITNPEGMPCSRSKECGSMRRARFGQSAC